MGRSAASMGYRTGQVQDETGLLDLGEQRER